MEKNEKILSFISEEVQKHHKRTVLESRLKEINEELSALNEATEKQEEVPEYQKNVYEGYEKHIEEIVSNLAETANLIETCIAKQQAHQKNIPEVIERQDASKKILEMLMEIYKDVKSTKLKAQRKMYEK